MATETSSQPLLSINQAAQFLGVSPSTIRRWARNGTLAGVRVGSRGDWRFTANDLSTLITSSGSSSSKVYIGPAGIDKSIHRHAAKNFQPNDQDPGLLALQRLDLAQKAGNIGTFDWDFTSNNIVFSEQALLIFGFKTGELVGNYQSAVELIHPDDRQMARELSQQAINGSGELNIEYRIIRPDTTVAWINTKGLVVKDAAGRIQKLLGVVIDITDRKRAEEALRISEERYRRLVAAAPVGIAVHDGTKLLYINEVGAKMMGASTIDQMIGQPIMRFVHPDSMAVVDQRRRNMIENGGHNPMIEEKYIRLDGKVINVEAISTPTIFEGRPAVQLFVNDITERKQNEAALQAARDEAARRQRLYETMTTSTLDLMYVFDLDYRFTYANQALLDMWGKTWDESIGKGLRDLGYEEWHAQMHEREIDQVVATKQPVRGEVSFPHATLGKRIYDYILTPVVNADGQVEAVAGTTRDITEINKLIKQKDEFIGVASHELKTPVTSIKAYAQALQNRFRKRGDQAAANQLDKIDQQLNKLTNLINDLLDVTKIEAGQLKLHESRFDLDELVVEIIEDLQHTTDRHTIAKQGKFNHLVWGDRERVGQVLTNVLSNAIKYSPDSDHVIVHCQDQKGFAQIGVQDFGVGLASDKQQRVFERFFRVSGPQLDTFPGLGLGLYISSQIVDRLGGKLWVESTEGQGATFFFTVPTEKGQINHEISPKRSSTARSKK